MAESKPENPQKSEAGAAGIGQVRTSTRSKCLSGLIKRSFSLAGHRTSVALEQEFWEVLMRMAQARGQSLSALVAASDTARGPGRPLASALRVMALSDRCHGT